MMAIRENLQRGIDGLDNQSLHTQCAVGTKRLIEAYAGTDDPVPRMGALYECACLSTLFCYVVCCEVCYVVCVIPGRTCACRTPSHKLPWGTLLALGSVAEEVAQQLEDLVATKEVDNATKRRFFVDSRQAFGRTALLLSGGMSFGMCVAFLLAVSMQCLLCIGALGCYGYSIVLLTCASVV